MAEPYSGGCYVATYPPGVMTRFGPWVVLTPVVPVSQFRPIHLPHSSHVSPAVWFASRSAGSTSRGRRRRCAGRATWTARWRQASGRRARCCTPEAKCPPRKSGPRSPPTRQGFQNERIQVGPGGSASPNRRKLYLLILHRAHTLVHFSVGVHLTDRKTQFYAPNQFWVKVKSRVKPRPLQPPPLPHRSWI